MAEATLTQPDTATGPVSEVLLAELKELVRQRALVVWLDPAATYSAFVDGLGGDFAPVARFRGSFARLLRDAAPYAREVSPTPLLVHLAGLDEATVVRTPALELAAAGYRWQRDLPGLVTAAADGRVPPADIARFAASVLTLDEADAWLSERLAEAEGGLSAALRAMSLAEIVDQLLGKDRLAARVPHPSDLRDIWNHLHRVAGLPERWWLPLTPPDGRFSANDVAYALASWALCVEYIHDPVPRLERAEALVGVRDLPESVVAACRKLAHALRQREDDFYARTADETETRIAKERGVDPLTLGYVDTFRFEENALLRGALAALDPASDAPSAWEPVLRWAEGRAERSFWLRKDETRKMAWRLVLDAARLAQAIATAGPRLPRTLDLAGGVAWYASKGARVDQLHRVLEQDCAVLLRSELPEFEALVVAVDGVRAAWWAWAQDIAEDWSAICKREGFLPDAPLQQRTLFDEVVMGASASGRDDGVTAYFMVDALRYEMAEALRPTFDGAGTTASLSARLAELPTITDVGMNALAPVLVAGKLQPVLIDGAFKGFQVGEYRVKDPATRKRAIQARVGGATCPWMSLDEVTGRDPVSLRKAIAQARVVVVHSQEIDIAGESGIGLTTFEPILRRLREAWLRLREAGVRRFVITADHGFLLLRGASALPHGTRTDPSRRHVVSPVVADHVGEVRVPLASLGYVGTTDQLMMPASLQVFRTMQSGQTFAHGGNSLQERVIPVLVVTSKSPRGADGVRYEVRVSEKGGVAGMHRLQVTVVPQGELLFTGRREVDVVLRPRDADGVVMDVWLGNEQAEGQLRVVVGEPTELFFRLRGGVAARVGIEVACAGDVDAAPVMAGFFRVEAAKVEAPAPAGRGLREWLASIENPDHRQVLAHISAHGSITEAEVATMVGGTSKARRFGSALDDLVPPTAPMQVRVDSVDGVKRYVREDG
jgi:hypothetical protein